MSDDNEQTTSPVTFRNAVFGMNPRITLAFFLVTIAAFLIVWLGHVLINKTADAGTAALLAGLVTLVVKMADSSVGYQYQSSAGSDKKDTAQAAVTQELAKKFSGTGNGSEGAMQAAVAAAALAAPAAAAVAAPAAAAVAAPPAAEIAAPPVVNAVVPPAVEKAVADAMAAQKEVEKQT